MPIWPLSNFIQKLIIFFNIKIFNIYKCFWLDINRLWIILFLQWQAMNILINRLKSRLIIRITDTISLIFISHYNRLFDHISVLKPKVILIVNIQRVYLYKREPFTWLKLREIILFVLNEFEIIRSTSMTR